MNRDRDRMKPGKHDRKNLLGNDVGQTLVAMTIPTTIGTISLILFFIADTWFISLLGTRELAAYGFTFPASMFFAFIGVGIGIGTSALVARQVGGGRHDAAARIAFSSTLLGFAVGVAAALPAIAGIDFLFRNMGATEDVRGPIREYMTLWYCGMPLLMMQFAITASLRGCGNTAAYGKLMVAGAIINALLDPLFIFGPGPFPRLEMTGAAAASLVSWMATVGLSMYILRGEEGIWRVEWPGLQSLLAQWKEHLKLSMPAAAANAVTPVAIGIITATLATYGSEAVAGFGVVSRVEQFSIILVLGLSTSLPPFLSQNLGAGRADRVREALRLSFRFILIWQLIVYLIVGVAAGTVAAVFTDDQTVTSIIRSFLWILPASYGCQGLMVLTSSAFNALHAPRQALIMSLMRFFMFYLPCALIGEQIGGGTWPGRRCSNRQRGWRAVRCTLDHGLFVAPGNAEPGNLRDSLSIGPSARLRCPAVFRTMMVPVPGRRRRSDPGTEQSCNILPSGQTDPIRQQQLSPALRR